MTVDRGLFDHTGAQPPATKITIELPPEYIEKPEPDATPPYNGFRVDAKVLADIQTAVMREYGGVARRCLNAFRQDVGLGDLAINGRRTNLGAGVGMSYTSQFGNESIRIHVSKEGVRRLLGGKDDLYMLVLYGSNKIAYIPMADISSPNGKVKTRILDDSDWTPPQWFNQMFESWGVGQEVWRMQIFQAKLSSDWHVLSANIKISSDGVISIPEKADQTPVYNTLDTLLKSAESTTPYSDAVTTQPSFFTFRVNMQMNGSGKTMYNDRHDKFTWDSKNGVKRTDVYTDNFTKLVSTNGGTTFTYPTTSYTTYVASDGGRYSDFTVSTLITNWWGGTTPITNPQNAIRHQSASWESPTYYTDLFIGFNAIMSFGPGNSDIIYDNKPSTVESFTLTASSWLPKWNKTSDGLDVISGISSTPTVNFNAGEYGGFGPGWNYTLSNYFGYTDTISDYANSGWRWILPFPPSLGQNQDELFFVYAQDTYAGDGSGWLQTPYGKHDVADMIGDFWFLPWMHVSNGEHMMQGYQWNGGIKIWLDRKDYGQALADAIGCQLNDIRGAIFDIKLKDIKKLK